MTLTRGMKAAIIAILLITFTLVEYVTLVYWLDFGNSPTGLNILLLGLLLEHALSIVAGYAAGIFFPARSSSADSGSSTNSSPSNATARDADTNCHSSEPGTSTTLKESPGFSSSQELFYS